jgi:general stress protein 26
VLQKTLAAHLPHSGGTPLALLHGMDADEKDLENLLDIVNRTRVAMMTTTEPDSSLRSRPLATLRTSEFSGFLWFFTAADSSKVSEIGEHHQVNLSYSDPERHRYASVSGLGLTLRDVEKMAELWDPIVKAWFPDGLDDPNLVLLRVSVDKAEYWDASATPVQRLLAFTKAFKSGDPSEIGEHKKLRLNPGQN